MTLDQLEPAIQAVIRPRRDKVNFIRYADDFIVTAAGREVLEERVKPVIAVFLRERGLSLSEEKTKITHIEEGFDFLGHCGGGPTTTAMSSPEKHSTRSNGM